MSHELKTDAILLRWVRQIIVMLVTAAVVVLIVVYVQRDQLIAGCYRSGVRATITAKALENPADRVALRRTIPMPDGWHGDPATRGDDKREVKAGCGDAFPPPVPFVD